MPHFFIKSFKVGLLLLLPLFYSSSFINKSFEESRTKNGQYLLKTKGDKEINLQGTISFLTSIEVSANGEKYAVLKLDLSDTKSINGHSFGFIVSEPYGKSKEIGAGTYPITSQINGFLNYFEGVFGFANISAFGELPYFAKEGSITIESMDQTKLEGFLDIIFINPDGENISVIGNFDADRE
ncbi:MAG: hypothetical protein WBN11_12800 [Eudoraea sp.]|uniref:hypothetical protein n=1 Tax=Eudoraea sp. TaxID=1979955 RepID=UPI003C77CE88